MRSVARPSSRRPATTPAAAAAAAITARLSRFIAAFSRCVAVSGRRLVARHRSLASVPAEAAQAAPQVVEDEPDRRLLRGRRGDRVLALADEEDASRAELGLQLRQRPRACRARAG